MEINLEPKQSLAFLTPATEVLYGGAKGGGKSFLMRASALRWAMEVPGIQVYLFRRTLADLRRNHLEGPKSFPVMLKEHLDSGHVKYHDKDKQYSFWNGSNINLCYCESERDVENYQGAEIHVLMPDEATHYTEYQYRYLRGQVRLAGLKVPEQYKGRLPRIEAGANPGSVGHAWVKRTFINPKPPLEMWRADASEGGMLRQFIPARLSDNPHLTADDPEYADRLRGMGSDDLVRAMLEGDWDIIAGQAFEKLRREIHCIDAFTPPDDWLCFGSLDWGSSAPFSFGLWAVSNGNALPDGRTYRRGAMLRYNELYGWSGKPNEGQRKEATEVADAIKARINGRRLAYIAADPSMWKVDGGPSIAETMLRRGIVLRKADHNRLTGYVEVRQRIAGDGDGPMLYATRNCHDGFWRTMPDIVMDKSHIEDVDCWVAGTLISTPNGEIPIEKVAVGQLVDTPIGPRRVLKSYVSGAAETVLVSLQDGRVLQGTGRHKILVDGCGLMRLDALQCHLTLTEKIKWQRSLFILAACIEGMRAVFTTILGAVESVCIARNGLMSAVRSQADIISTTEMGITTTMRFPILSACRVQFIPDFTLRSDWPGFLGENSKRGESQRTESAHSEQMPKRCWQTLPSAHLRAAIVGCLLLQHILVGIGVRFVRIFSRTKGANESCVPYADQNSWQSRTERKKCEPARIVAVGHCAEKTLVYNLTVDEAHLFYANGILSSNTDSEDHCYDEVRYACVSRPWMQAPNRKVVKPDRWLMRFEQYDMESQNWKTA